MSDDPYVYEGTSILRNKLDIRSNEGLEVVERQLVMQRASEGIPKGNFDLEHLRVIHRHLFQDIYPWAGETRTVEISKGDQQFQFCQFIETGMADIHKRLTEKNFLKGLRSAAFAKEAAEIIGDINYVHPFREGNGRAQMHYLDQLAHNAGHYMELSLIPQDQWIAASREAHETSYDRMADCIAEGLVPMPTRSRPIERGDEGRER